MKVAATSQCLNICDSDMSKKIEYVVDDYEERKFKVTARLEVQVDIRLSNSGVSEYNDFTTYMRIDISSYIHTYDEINDAVNLNVILDQYE